MGKQFLTLVKLGYELNSDFSGLYHNNNLRKGLIGIPMYFSLTFPAFVFDVLLIYIILRHHLMCICVTDLCRNGLSFP